jgi:hypothetical protein
VFVFPLSRRTITFSLNLTHVNPPLRLTLFPSSSSLSLHHFPSVFNAVARSFNPPFISIDMQLNNSDFSTTPYPTHRSLRHFPRAPSRGLDHTTLIIIIAVSVSVGGLLLTIIIWRFVSRLLRPESAPLPPRQSLVHLRELHIAEFTEYKDASVPQILTNGSYIHETDETTLGSSDGDQLHPPSPQFFSSRTPPSGSSSSLPSSNDDSALSSGAATPPTQISTSGSLSPSSRRAMNPSMPRPLSTFSTTTSSRQSIRAAPHAPHSNVQVILPAPLAPGLYEGTASDGSLLQRTLTRNSTYSVQDSWRRSLADSWILVGQPNPEPMERQYEHDSVERPTRLIRSMFVAFSMISILNALFPKEDPPRGHVLCEVNPTHHHPPAFVRLRGWISSRKVHIPQYRAYLLNLGHFLVTPLSLLLHPHGKEDPSH